MVKNAIATGLYKLLAAEEQTYNGFRLRTAATYATLFMLIPFSAPLTAACACFPC